MREARRLELAVDVLAADAETSIGAFDDSYYRVSAVPGPPAGCVVRLRDSAGLILWEPWGEEFPPAGRVFGEVLRHLYDGREWRLCLTLEEEWLQTGIGGRCPSVAGSGPQGVAAPLPGLSLAFRQSRADDAGFEWGRDYWWCLKSALPEVFRAGWSPHGPNGYIVARGSEADLRRALGERDPRTALGKLLQSCRFVFQNLHHGAQMLLLSRRLSLGQVRAAVSHHSVRRALRALSERAIFAEWRAIGTRDGYVVHAKGDIDLDTLERDHSYWRVVPQAE